MIEQQGERPDFVLRVGDRRVGLEHTELEEELLGRAAARITAFETALIDELRSLGGAEDFDVAVIAFEGGSRFAGVGRKETARAASVIAKLITRAIADAKPGEDIRVDAAAVAALRIGGIQSVVLHRIEGLRGPLCYVQKSYWAAGEAEVLLAIRAKEALLPEYRADASLSEVWLLLVTGDRLSQTADLLMVQDAWFASDFERVYLLDVRAGKARRIDQRAAPLRELHGALAQAGEPRGSGLRVLRRPGHRIIRRTPPCHLQSTFRRASTGWAFPSPQPCAGTRGATQRLRRVVAVDGGSSLLRRVRRVPEQCRNLDRLAYWGMMLREALVRPREHDPAVAGSSKDVIVALGEAAVGAYDSHLAADDYRGYLSRGGVPAHKVRRDARHVGHFAGQVGRANPNWHSADITKVSCPAHLGEQDAEPSGKG